MANKNKKSKNWTSFFRDGIYRNILAFGLFIVLLFIFIIGKMDIKTLNLKLGDLAEREIRANKEIEDRRATEELRNEIRKNNEKIYKHSPSVQTNMKSSVGSFIYNIKKYRDEELSLDKKIEAIEKTGKLGLDQEDYKTAFSMDDRELDDFKMVLDDLISQIMSPGVEESQLADIEESIDLIFEGFDFKKNKHELGVNIISSVIEPNKFYDEEETLKNLNEKLESLEPVMIKEHQVILRKDERVTKESLLILEELGMLKNKRGDRLNTIIGVMILTLLLAAFLYGYIRIFLPEILKDNRLALVFIVILGTLFLSELMYNISPYIMPVAISSMLLGLLIDIRLGILVNLFISFILALSLKLDNGVIAMYLISGSLGSYLVKQNQQRYDLMITGSFIGLVNVISIISFGLIKNFALREIFLRSIYGFVNGIICGILTIGSLPLWENAFKIITPLRLMELSNPNQPLLKQLLLEAPGTYHHSIVVGNLSERAAEHVGADPLLARTGAYYHDIGKLKRPYFFKENQIGMSNPHDKLRPEVSAQIITNHVKDGVELAKKHKLPKEIIDILEQHHGDTKVMYFYYKAKEENPDVDIKDFQYSGPRPQTKEAAIVMMADSSEAAVRSIANPSKESIEDMVRKVIGGKLESEQFSDCDINFRDIALIEREFIDTFLGMFHERIEYPEMDDLK